MKLKFPLLLGLGLAIPLVMPTRAHAQDLPRLSVGDASVLEGNTNLRFREITFPVSIPKAVTFDVSARYRTVDGSALAPGDYTAQPAGQVVIKAGQKSAKIILRVTTDAVEEADEQFTVRLFEPKRATFADAEAVATIRDDDYAGEISIGDVSIAEGNSGSTIAALPLNFSRAPLHPIGLRFQTVDDTAKVPLDDYSTTRGTLQVQPGASGLAIAVPVVGDTTVETDEKFFVRLSAEGYRISKSLGVGTIRNDDVPPPTPTPTPLPPSVALSVADISVAEGNGETTNSQTGIDGDNSTPAIFTITLAEAAKREITVTYMTQDGSAPAPPTTPPAPPATNPAPAMAPVDYQSTTGTVVFKVGDTTATFSVPVIGDRTEEIDKAFTVKLSTPGGVTGDAEAVALIRDDDYSGTISIGDTSVVEGNRGTTLAQLPVTLSPAPLHPLEVIYGTHDGTATAPQDYTAKSGKLVFAAGTSTLPIEVQVRGERAQESDETFTVEISSNGASFAKFSGLITITNDDVPLKVSDLTGKIAFASTRDGNEEIYVMNANGTNQTRLTNNPASDSYPRFSGDGSKIVFQSLRDGNSEIYVMNADGTNQTRLTTNNGPSDTSPTFSPDGTRIAFESTRSGSRQIYVMNVDGTNQTRLASATSDISPAFSPDGSKIAFIIFGGTDQLAIMNADGTNRVVVAGKTEQIFAIFPTFSPDGQRITLSVYDLNGNSSGYQLYTVNVNGTGLNRITFNFSDDVFPTYSPDGNNIAFSSNRANVDGIFVVRDNGSEELPLVNGNSPSWSSGTVPGKSGASVPKGGKSAGSS